MTNQRRVLDGESEPCEATKGERVDALFAAKPQCIREARQFVAQQLNGRSPDLVSDTVLMVSELTTNCIVHARSPFKVSIISDGQTICVEVTDNGTGTPTCQPLDPLRSSGRGLQIIEQLSNTWGVTPKDDHGKTVWFTIEP